MDFFEMIMDWIVIPILEFLERRHTSGRWHLSHLLPIATVACVGVWWLGEHWNSVVLLVLGVLGASMFGLLSLILWIPREVEANKDFKSYFAKRKREAEKLQKRTTDGNGKDA